MVYKKISTADLNQVVIKASPGEVEGWYIVNKTTGFRFVKLFDSATNPDMAVATPKLTLGIPALSAANVALNSHLTFAAGIAIGMTGGIPIGSTGPVGAGDLAVNIFYS